MASAVEFDPAPATTGTRPAASCTQISMTRLCSSWLSVADSPVVPAGLVRQGGVVMMQPIGESENGAPAQVFGGERRTPAVRSLSATDHDLFDRAVAAALRGNWADARALAAQARDPVIRLVVEWA